MKVCAIGVLIAALFVGAFWHTFEGLWQTWLNNSDYSAGLLVPLAAAYMMVVRRDELRGLVPGFALAGAGLYLLGVAADLAGKYFLYRSVSNIGMVICANGLVLGLLGWPIYRRLLYPMLFLVLMIPLPGRVHDTIMLPLQTLGAFVSAGVLEVLGIPVQLRGHLLVLGSHELAVAEACNGLRMALPFLMIAGILAYLVKRPAWQKIIVILSSLPIALFCNVVRIVVTASMYNAGYERFAQGEFHDLAGLLMMPVAFFLVLAEIRLLAGFEEDPDDYDAVEGQASTA